MRRKVEIAIRSPRTGLRSCRSVLGAAQRISDKAFPVNSEIKYQRDALATDVARRAPMGEAGLSPGVSFASHKLAFRQWAAVSAARILVSSLAVRRVAKVVVSVGPYPFTIRRRNKVECPANMVR
jgi:hypothetical protein